jgi:hypothetical protein
MRCAGWASRNGLGADRNHGGADHGGLALGRRQEGELYDWETAKAWLFGTNTRLDDQSPVEVLGTVKTDQEFTDVARAAKQFASSDG